MTLKIHAFPQSPRNFKVLLVANHLGLDYEFCFCDLQAGAQALMLDMHFVIEQPARSARLPDRECGAPGS